MMERRTKTSLARSGPMTNAEGQLAPPVISSELADQRNCSEEA